MDNVLDALKQLPKVTEAYLLYGVYDLMAKVCAEAKTQLIPHHRDHTLAS
jgi:DNA-binding Lrp family transcriptional regulator